MKHHKGKALEKDCLCNKCIFRFQCFTQERIFSDPILQGLFEALMAKGRSKEEALEEVTEEIKFRMGGKGVDGIYDSSSGSYPDTTHQPWQISKDFGSVTLSDVHDDVDGPKVDITYILNTGEEIRWSANAGEFD